MKDAHAHDPTGLMDSAFHLPSCFSCVAVSSDSFESLNRMFGGPFSDSLPTPAATLFSSPAPLSSSPRTCWDFPSQHCHLLKVSLLLLCWVCLCPQDKPCSYPQVKRPIGAHALIFPPSEFSPPLYHLSCQCPSDLDMYSFTITFPVLRAPATTQ